jgi:iron complex outermembrane recepter protein
VPISETAFNADDIDSAGIETPQDFIALTPNVTVVQVQNAGNSFVTIRGITQNRNTEPSVATLVDGVLMSNPAQFNQELYDIEQIEVLRGPQGAVYGRNAIGGAILITTRQPTDEVEGRIRIGADSGPGYKLQGAMSGPIGDSNVWKWRGAFSYKDTDGYLDNTYLDEKADPYKDVSGRLKFLYQPSDRFSADIRASFSNLDTQALYYNIRSPLPEPFPGAPISLGHGNGDPNSVNDTSLPIRVNNPGVNSRDLGNVSLKLDWNLAGGALTSITSYDTLEELLTGDNFDFLPIAESIGVAFGGSDTNQSQYLDMDTLSQEVRFTSSADERLRWIAGAYAITTNRFISTGQMIDTGAGVFPVYHSPSTNPSNPSVTFLADSQDNFAWAAFGELAYDFSDKLEGTFSLRYDDDTRKNTTETPTAFLPNVPGFPQGATGEVRKHSWNDLQPRFSLRYVRSDTATFYGSLGRGFRSGGFNQTGVGAVAAGNGIVGVEDLFDQETTDTFEVGYKGLHANNRVRTDLSLFHTVAKGTYFFIFLQANSTQNLGNLGEVKFDGLEFELAASLTQQLDLNLGLGVTDSKITDSKDPRDIGDKASNVSENTVNLGLQYHKPMGTGELTLRGDYQVLGKTAFYDWEQDGTNDRDPVHLLDLRVGYRASNNWDVTLWGKNVLDEKYNTEYSTFGFVFKALPARWGVDFTKNF